MADFKEQAHNLIDRLPSTQLGALVGLLEAMLDSTSASSSDLAEEDETLSTAGESALDDAHAWSQKNSPVSHEQVLAELGITQKEVEDFEESK